MKAKALEETMKALIRDGYQCFEMKQKNERPGTLPALTIVWGNTGIGDM